MDKSLRDPVRAYIEGVPSGLHARPTGSDGHSLPKELVIAVADYFGKHSEGVNLDFLLRVFFSRYIQIIEVYSLKIPDKISIYRRI